MLPDSLAPKRRRFPLAARIRLTLLFGFLLCYAVWAGCVMIRMPGKSFAGPLPPLTERQGALASELREHVEFLAGSIGPRYSGLMDHLHAARDYIVTELTEPRAEVNLDHYTFSGYTFSNVIAEVRGSKLPKDIIVIGAHYDTAGATPGANDNASGVAALLALAKASRGQTFERTVRWVAFVNEEPPFFQGKGMGSWVYAKGCRSRGEQIVAMLSLETMGYYRDEPRSQKYPFPLSAFYPSTGNFVAFVGNTESAALVKQIVRSFREHAQFPSEGAALHGWIPGVGWSDHWSFWQEGYPGVMVTDTAPFRYPHYHELTDTPEKLDYERFARVVEGLNHVIRQLLSPPP